MPMCGPGGETYDPTDDECPQCGGEGFVFECFDGCCEDNEIGCDDCTRPCSECTKRPASDELRQVLADALSSNTIRIQEKPYQARRTTNAFLNCGRCGTRMAFVCWVSDDDGEITLSTQEGK